MSGRRDGIGGFDDDGTVGSDEFARLLRPPVDLMPPPPGSYERIRRGARRRRARAAAGGGMVVVLAAAVSLALYLVNPASTRMTNPPVASRSNPTTSASPHASPTASPTPHPTADSGSQRTSGGDGAVPLPPAPPGTAAATSPAVTAPMCAASQLTLSIGASDAGAGSVYAILVLTNTSSVSCHVKGYPGLSLLDASGRQIGPAATYDPGEDLPVVLAPGASASATMRLRNDAPSNCLQASTSVRVYPPGDKDTVVGPGSLTICDNTFSVTPFAAGTNGNAST